MGKLLIIIPTYNESQNILLFLEKLYESCKDLNFSVLVVDDNSPDGTAIIVKNWMNDHSNCHLLNREKKEGLGKAYIAGFKWGLNKDFDYFCQIDADFSHDPIYIPSFLEKTNDFDFIIGSRYVTGGGVKGWGLLRRIISRGGSLYSKIILNSKINDFTGGFNLWNRNVLESINLDSLFSSGYSFQIEMKYRATKKGFKFYEFPIIFTDRVKGNSKMSKSIVFEAMLNVLKLRFKKIF
ncbi:MAG: polyprenol monophosphomannose synthase [Exilispira sp.]|jgi:dolichol-phosphate mannosyltransferase|nr:polyprenol monophosphomannose synthase [Exilispira sp.]